MNLLYHLVRNLAAEVLTASDKLSRIIKKGDDDHPHNATENNESSEEAKNDIFNAKKVVVHGEIVSHDLGVSRQCDIAITLFYIVEVMSHTLRSKNLVNLR